MRLKFDFETMELDDSFIVIPVGEGASNYHGIIKVNDVGEEIIRLLKDDISEDTIVEMLLKEYDISQETLRACVLSFLSEFEKKGMLIQ